MDKNNPFVYKKSKDVKNLPVFESLDDNNYCYEEIEKGILIPVARLSLWQDFIKLSNNRLSYQKNLIFRGQQDPKWKLTPTLKRTHSFLGEKEINKIIQKFKYSLKNIKHPDLKNLKFFNENHFWALGRHYGLPIPLLDWTLNPLVALYFAYEDRANLYAHHAIYIMDIKKCNNNDFIYVNNHPYQNEREKKQSGCYVNLKKHKSLESIISNDENLPSYFRKVYITKNSPQDCLDELEKQHNISKLTLYPNSIEGAVEYIKTQIPSPYEMKGTLVTIRQSVT